MPRDARLLHRVAVIAVTVGLVAGASSCVAPGSDRARAPAATTSTAVASSVAQSPDTPVESSVTTTAPLLLDTVPTTTIPRRPWPTDADPSPGCANPSMLLSGETIRSSVAVPGRSSLLVAGAGITADYPTPLIVLLHGRSSDGATITAYSGFAAAAERLGALLLAPDALPPTRAWTADDVAFLTSVLDELGAQQCIDRNRVWLAGLSLGGFMSARLACDLAGRFAAVGAVAGFGFDPARCATAPAVPVTLFHGTADPVIIYDGTPPTFTDFEPSSGAPRAIADWAAHNGCAPTPVDVITSSEVMRRSFDGCRAETVLYIINGGGHTWPDATPIPTLGLTTAQVSATAVFADFFARHVRGHTPL